MPSAVCGGLSNPSRCLSTMVVIIIMTRVTIAIMTRAISRITTDPNKTCLTIIFNNGSIDGVNEYPRHTLYDGDDVHRHMNYILSMKGLPAHG
jgi:hypothetical protein